MTNFTPGLSRLGSHSVVWFDQEGCSHARAKRSFRVIPVQDIVLDHEDRIEEDGNVAEQQLDRVTGDTAPVTLKTGVEYQLNHRKNSASQIQQNGPNIPAYR